MSTLPSLPTDEELAAYFDAATAMLDLAIDPLWRTAALTNLKTLAMAAQLVQDFALDDEAEPAPVFAP